MRRDELLRWFHANSAVGWLQQQLGRAQLPSDPPKSVLLDHAAALLEYVAAAEASAAGDGGKYSKAVEHVATSEMETVPPPAKRPSRAPGRPPVIAAGVEDILAAAHARAAIASSRPPPASPRPVPAHASSASGKSAVAPTAWLAEPPAGPAAEPAAEPPSAESPREKPADSVGGVKSPICFGDFDDRLLSDDVPDRLPREESLPPTQVQPLVAPEAWSATGQAPLQPLMVPAQQAAVQQLALLSCLSGMAPLALGGAAACMAAPPSAQHSQACMQFVPVMQAMPGMSIAGLQAGQQPGMPGQQLVPVVFAVPVNALQADGSIAGGQILQMVPIPMPAATGDYGSGMPNPAVCVPQGSGTLQSSGVLQGMALSPHAVAGLTASCLQFGLAGAPGPGDGPGAAG